MTNGRAYAAAIPGAGFQLLKDTGHLRSSNPPAADARDLAQRRQRHYPGVSTASATSPAGALSGEAEAGGVSVLVAGPARWVSTSVT